MGFFNYLPVPEYLEWAFSIPFPFPNTQKSFPLTPDVVKASEEDRRESLKSATISFEDADERVKKGTFMEFFLDARRSLPGVVKCIHKFTLSKTEMEGRFLQFRIK